MTTEVYHPRHNLGVREYGDGSISLVRDDLILQLTTDQARWLAREIEHLAATKTKN